MYVKNTANWGGSQTLVRGPLGGPSRRWQGPHGNEIKYKRVSLERYYMKLFYILMCVFTMQLKHWCWLKMRNDEFLSHHPPSYDSQWFGPLPVCTWHTCLCGASLSMVLTDHGKYILQTLTLNNYFLLSQCFRFKHKPFFRLKITPCVRRRKPSCRCPEVSVKTPGFVATIRKFPRFRGHRFKNYTPPKRWRKISALACITSTFPVLTLF